MGRGCSPASGVAANRGSDGEMRSARARATGGFELRVLGDRERMPMGLYRARAWRRGRRGIAIPRRSRCRARSARAPVRRVVGEGLGIGRAPRVSGRGREESERATEGRGVRACAALGQAGSVAGGLRLSAAGPVGLGVGSAGWPGSRLGLFPFF